MVRVLLSRFLRWWILLFMYLTIIIIKKKLKQNSLQEWKSLAAGGCRSVQAALMCWLFQIKGTRRDADAEEAQLWCLPVRLKPSSVKEENHYLRLSSFHRRKGRSLSTHSDRLSSRTIVFYFSPIKYSWEIHLSSILPCPDFVLACFSRLTGFPKT